MVLMGPLRASDPRKPYGRCPENGGRYQGNRQPHGWFHGDPTPYNLPLRRRSTTSPARARMPTIRRPKTATWLVPHTDLVSSCSAARSIGSIGSPAPSLAPAAEVSTTNSYAPLTGWPSAEVTRHSTV